MAGRAPGDCMIRPVALAVAWTGGVRGRTWAPAGRGFSPGLPAISEGGPPSACERLSAAFVATRVRSGRSCGRLLGRCGTGRTRGSVAGAPWSGDGPGRRGGRSPPRRPSPSWARVQPRARQSPRADGRGTRTSCRSRKFWWGSLATEVAMFRDEKRSPGGLRVDDALDQVS